MPQLLYEIKMTGYAVGEDADDAIENFRADADLIDLDVDSELTYQVINQLWEDSYPYGDDKGHNCKWWAEQTRQHDKLVKERKEWESRQKKMFKGFNE